MYIETENDVKAAALEIAQTFPDLNYSGGPINPDGELVLRLQEIISRHLPSSTGARTCHCSCGTACTAEEYIEHYFEKGHDRGGAADAGEVERLRAENTRFKEQFALLDDPDGLYSEARAKIESDARTNAVREAVAQVQTMRADWFNEWATPGTSDSQYRRHDTADEIITALQSLVDKKEGEDGPASSNES